MIGSDEFTTLRGHPALADLGLEVAATQRACYGREALSLNCGGDTVFAVFAPVAAAQAEMQWRIRCLGFEFELQFVDAAALFDLGSALSPGVPLALQRAAVLHAASDLLEAVERRLGARIELVGLSASSPAWRADEAIGLKATRRSGAPEKIERHGAVLLRALQAEGWRRLEHLALRMPLGPPQHDLRLDIALHAEAVAISLGELRRIEPGDHLVLRAAATALASPTVSFKLGQQTLPGVCASIDERRVRITAAAFDLVSEASSWQPGADAPHSPWSMPMNPLDTAPQAERGDGNPDADAADAAAMPTVRAHPLDDVKVEIEFELGRLSLPVSALRALAVGQVFECAQAIDGKGIVLWAGGQRLGCGQLVAVGERLAVRVIALHARPPEGPVGGPAGQA